MSAEKGFTLFEVLIVLVLFTLLTRTALMGFPELKKSFNRNAARQQLEFDLQRARAEALAVGARVMFTIAAGGNSYSVGLDEHPFSSLGTPDETLFSNELPAQIVLASDEQIIFSSAGYLIDVDGEITDTTVTLSDDEGTILNGILYAIGSVYYE